MGRGLWRAWTLQFKSHLVQYLKSTCYAGNDDARHLVSAAIQETRIHTGAKYTTAHGEFVKVCASAKFGTSQKPWYDFAIVKFDASDDPTTERWQLGYVQICICFEIIGKHFMLVRWLTSAQLGGAIENRENEFESHHIRNLPRLTWNARNSSCNRSFQVLPVSVLWKGAWVHQDYHDPNIFWHIKSSYFYMHQDPEQAMSIVAGSYK